MVAVSDFTTNRRELNNERSISSAVSGIAVASSFSSRHAQGLQLHIFRLVMFVVGLAVLSLAGFCSSALADEAPVPALHARVTDTTKTLTATEKRRIESKLALLEKNTGAQVAVLMIDRLGSEDTIESYAGRVFDEWRLGRKGVDDGVLFVIAMRDQRMRIETGYGLEGTITNAEASRIIRRDIVPRFNKDDFAGGINRAVDHMITLILSDDSISGLDYSDDDEESSL